MEFYYEYNEKRFSFIDENECIIKWILNADFTNEFENFETEDNRKNSKENLKGESMIEEKQIFDLNLFFATNFVDNFNSNVSPIRKSSNQIPLAINLNLNADYCTICLEKFDKNGEKSNTIQKNKKKYSKDTADMSKKDVVITVLCGHKFHLECLEKWQHDTCPICRYEVYPLEQTFCNVCDKTEGLWSCLTCGFVGCGSGDLPLEGHTRDHYSQTGHNYMKKIIYLGQRIQIFDHVRGDFVQSFIYDEQNRNSSDEMGTQNPKITKQVDWDSENYKEKGDLKRQDLMNDYSEIIATQLESQREYYENLLKQVEHEILAMKGDKEAIASQMRIELEKLEDLHQKKVSESAESKEELMAHKEKYDNLLTVKQEMLIENANIIRKVNEKQYEKKSQIFKKNSELNEIKNHIKNVVKEVQDINSHLNHQDQLKRHNIQGDSIMVMNVGESNKPKNKKR